jgi:sulfur-oxidizing protein SoxZ
MSDTIRILAEAESGVTVFRTLIRHPMETGMREDEKTGEKVLAHFIQEVTVEHDGRVVFKALWGTGISENPYLACKFKGGRPGDPIKLTWVDNKGRTDSLVGRIEQP